ncbi:MAG: prophage regulatory protein [Zhongshania sp.]|jgi:prophage regulatory protein
MQSNLTPQFFSVKALAGRWDVSRSTIWRWRAEGKLPDPIKINGSTRWPLPDIEALEKTFRPKDTMGGM